jgi:tetratricopeptide (TPR) repeat protein
METIAWIENYLAEAERLIFDGMVSEGMNILTNLLYEEPGYGRLHNHLGWAYMYHANDAVKAENHFRLAMRFAPELAAPYLHMGNLLSRAARYSEAISYFREGLSRPQAIKVALLEGMANAHELNGEYRMAIRFYKEAAIQTVADYEVDRVLKSVKRCRRKRFALLFSFW